MSHEAITATNWIAAAQGDDGARMRVLESHVKLVWRIAHDLVRTCDDEVELDGLASAGFVGLIQAFEGFDHTRGLAFSTYAVPRVRGAMLDELRRMDPASREMRQRARKVAAATESLGHRLGRAPSEAEIAHVVGIGTEDLARHRQVMKIAEPLRLDQTVTNDARDLPLGHAVAAPTGPDHLLEADEQDLVYAGLSELPEMERAILGMWLYEDLGPNDIAELFGYSEGNILRLRKQAMERLRSRFERTVWKPTSALVS